MSHEFEITEGHPQPYTVRFKSRGWDMDEYYEMIHWCEDNFGPRNRKFNNPRWSFDSWNRKFKFKNEKDAMMLMLRWS